MTPNAYWLQRAPNYAGETRLAAPFYRAQEAAIVGIVQEIAPKSILEVGCNAGRITGAIHTALPSIQMAACDLSVDAIVKARTAVPRVRQPQWIIARLYFFEHDLYSPDELPKADLCLAVEVFLHHPIEAVRGFVEKVLRACPVLLHEFDPAVSPGDTVAPHCYAHDYLSLYREMGLPVNVEVIGAHAFMLVSRAA